MNDDALQTLLQPISDEAPTGPDLEYDADFMALERLATVKAERSIGDAVIAAEEPDWDRVAQAAQELLARSKDLRVAMHLTTAWLRTGGLAGLADGLALIHGLLDGYWDGVHPQLDAEDDDDPTARVNAVVPLGDPLGTLRYLRSTPFVQSPRIGRFTLRDLRLANGTLKLADNPDGNGLPTMTDIEACCMDCPEDELSAALAAAGQILDRGKAIDALFSERVGTAGPELKALLTDAFELRRFIESQMTRRQPQGTADGEAVAGDGEDAAGSAPGGGTAASGGRIQSPEDVRRRIDELCDYYARSEPSSPVPILLRRAQRLVGRNFVDLLQDLAPGGLSELRTIAGSDEES